MWKRNEWNEWKEWKVLLALLLGCLFGATGAFAGDLTVRVSVETETMGKMVRLALYDKEEGFMELEKARGGQFLRYEGGELLISFHNLPAGSYAVAAFYDEDNDEELGSNLLGIPNEPYGFLNDARGSFGPPDFAEAAITVGAQGETSGELHLK